MEDSVQGGGVQDWTEEFHIRLRKMLLGLKGDKRATHACIARSLPSQQDISCISVWSREGKRTLPSCPADVVYLQRYLGALWTEHRPSEPVPDLVEAYLRANPSAELAIAAAEEAIHESPDGHDAQVIEHGPRQGTVTNELLELAERLDTTQRRLDPTRSFDRVIGRGMVRLEGALRTYGTRSMELGTHDLYETLVEELAKCDSAFIIDQDIRRWNELLDDADNIGFNTFNYSRNILKLSVAMASRRPSYEVHRVFVIPVDGNADLARICQILLAVEDQVRKFPDRLLNRVYVPTDEGEEHLTESGLQKVKDAVLLETGSDFLFLQEEIDWRKRTDSTKSVSRITAREEHRLLFKETFKYAFAESMTIEEFVTKYAGPELAGDRATK